MKRDLKINFAILEEIIREIRKYKSALKDMEAAASNIVSIFESNIADFIDEFKKLYIGYIKELRQCYTELDDLDTILTGYTNEMQAIIRPIDKNKPVRVDRNDIYFNKETIIGACRGIDFLVMNRGKSGLSYLSGFGKDEEEKQREEQNFRKLESIWREVIPRYSRRMNAQIEALNNIYNRKVIPYENKDDEYKAKAQVLYYKYSNPWEIFRSSFKADMKAVADFIGGAAKAIIDLVKGIAVLAWGILSYTASAVTLAVTYPFDARPKWAEQKFNQTNEAIGAILKNPMLIAEGMAQQISDTFEEKGAAYCVGYAAGDFFGGKGIDKLAKISKAKALGKSDAVDDIGDVVKVVDSGLDEVNNIVDLLKKSTCTKDELYKYLKQIDSYYKTNYVDDFLETGNWPHEIQIPKDSSVLDSNGCIDWYGNVPCDGYTIREVKKFNPLTGDVEKIKEAIKETYMPEIGEVIDRYGSSNGRYTSPTKYGVYTYEKRSLPYIEDVSKYHKYEIVGDFNKMHEYIEKCTDVDLITAIDAHVIKYYNGDYKNLLVYKGEIASGFNSVGGGLQYELPLRVDWLEQLGLLKEIK